MDVQSLELVLHS